MFKHIQLLAFALCALLVIPAAAQVPSYVPTDGLVGWWPFNGNANDESGNGNDGVVNGATLTEDRFGNLNSAYGFDGIDDYIDVGNNINLPNYSIAAWVNVSQLSTNPDLPSHIVSKISTFFENVSLHLWDNPSQFQVQHGNGTSWTGMYSIQPVILNQWQHVVASYNGNEIQLYIDGSFDSSTPELNYSDIQGFSTYLGSRPNNQGVPTPNSGNLHGSLDDIAIYNRALTESEIQSLYTSQCPTVSTPCITLPSNLQQGLVGYWPFCGNANDESGNGNDGVVNGATLTEDRFGNANAAYGFDGVDDFIQASVSELPLSNSERTLSIWVKYNSIPNPGEGYYILSYGSYIPFSFEGNSMGISNNTPIVTWRYSGYGTLGTYIDTPTEIDLNTWYNLTGVIENDVVKLYVNGILISEADATGWNTILTDLFIGRLVSEDDFTHGLLDDIGIWNRALTPEEVQELYTLDACTFTVYDTLTVYETVYDTVYTYETIYDTVTTYVTVTDTLLIDITFVGFEGQPSWLNTVTVFPNPASDHITIDYGNFALMAGYNTIITDAAGATVYSSAVNSQQVDIDINAWGATGVYYMSIYDANGELVAVRHIVLE